jgi:IS30 family transposase
MPSYTQLTQEERYLIYAFRQAGHKQCEIAMLLNRDKSTISRELRRNIGFRGYRPIQANTKAMDRRAEKARPRFSSPLWPIVERLIRQDWSPEQISGRLEMEHDATISHETIYRYIYADKAAGGDLHHHLRCRKKRRKRYGGGKDRRGAIPNRTSIEDRPAIVNDRLRIGDWEADTVIGRGHQGVLVTMVERRSLYTVIRAVPRKQAHAVAEAMTSALAPLGDRVLTVTVDNGKEFASHEKISKALGVDVYFAHPYASWERGTNENTNGLIRQYFPKSRSLRNLDHKEAQSSEDRLNNRPRKKLDFQTPHEVLFRVSNKLAVALAT